MPNVVRSTDINALGGAAIGGIPTVTVEGLPIMVPGMPVLPHAPYVPPHTVGLTVGGSTSVTAGGLPVISNADIDSCGDPRVTFAPTVTVGI